MAVEYEVDLSALTTFPYGSIQSTVETNLTAANGFPGAFEDEAGGWGNIKLDAGGGTPYIEMRSTVGGDSKLHWRNSVTKRDTYYYRYSVYFSSAGTSGHAADNGYDWGDCDGTPTANNTGGKLPGLLYGAVGDATGGTLLNGACSFRQMWRGMRKSDGIGGSNRESTGLECYYYGDDEGVQKRYMYGGTHVPGDAVLFTSDGTTRGTYGDPAVFDIPTDTWIHILTAVHAPDSTAGWFKAWTWIEGTDTSWQEQLYKTGMRPRPAGQSGIDGTLFQQFWGGSTAEWRPDRVAYTRFKDIGLYTTEQEAKDAFGLGDYNVTFYSSPADPAVPGGATVCTNDTEFTNAMNDVFPGGANAGDSLDIHLDGTFSGNRLFDGYTCTDAGTGLRIYGTPTTRQYINVSGTWSQWKFINCDTVSLFNLDIHSTAPDAQSDNLLVIGRSYDGDSTTGPCSDITIAHCEIRNSGQSIIKVSEKDTANITIRDCHLHTAGRRGNAFAEILYIGEGNLVGGQVQTINNITIRGNLIENNQANAAATGEAIDVKRGATNVTIEDNIIRDVEHTIGGAITFWANNWGGSNADGVIRRNRIYNIRDNGTGGNSGIFVGADCLIENNIIWDVDEHCIAITDNFAQADKNVYIRHNTLDATNASGGCIEINQDSYGEGGNDGTLTSQGNAFFGGGYVGSTAGHTVDDFTAVSGDFLGPISTGTAEYSTNGPGSGYTPTGGGGLVDDVSVPSTATAEDIQALARDANPDWGAIEWGVGLVLFAITSPVSGATQVSTPQTISGTSPNDGSNTVIQVRVYDATNTTTLEDWGSVAVTYTSGTQTWATDTQVTLPQAGESIEVDARRWG